MSSCLVKEGSSISKKRLKRFSNSQRKASIVRQFPNDCGRDVASALKEVNLKVNSSPQFEKEKCQTFNETSDKGFASQVPQIFDVPQTLHEGCQFKSIIKSEVLAASVETVENSRDSDDTTSLKFSRKASSLSSPSSVITSIDQHRSATQKTAKCSRFRASANRTFPVGCGRHTISASDQTREPVFLSENRDDCPIVNVETEMTKSQAMKEEIEAGATSEDMKAEEQAKKDDSLFDEKAKEFIKLIMDDHISILQMDSENVTVTKQAENKVKVKRKNEGEIQIAPLKRSKHEPMLSDKDATFSTVSKESSDSMKISNDHEESIITDLKPAKNKVKAKRKNEEQFQIAPMKKSKHELLLRNKDETFSTVSKESNDSMIGSKDQEESIARNKILHNLSIFQAIHAEMLKKEPSFASMQAYNVYREKPEGRNRCERLIGSVPGIKIGDEFNLRAEMLIAGLHSQLQAGIDYIKQNGREIAVSIVYTRRYSDNQKDLDLLVYSGSGLSNKDQKLERGNLALKNSMDDQSPVRVIHGIENGRGRKTKLYVYDGLYLVEKHWVDKGKAGYYVLMFLLRRISGQPRINEPPTVNLVDISNGEESIPIHLVNTIDRDQPTRFTYITNVMQPLLHIPSSPVGCDCIDGCSDSRLCACAAKNGGKLPFNDAGAIMKAKPLVYECGPSCMCPSSCMNRASQHGIKFQLEVFKTKSSGWGVRSSDFIPSGSFICEYVGEILEDEEAQKRNNDEYLFSIGNNYHDKNLWKGLSKSIPSLQKDTSGEMTSVGFAVDALKYGNVGRFINHSCTPNIYAQNILYDHDDIRMPHIMFFASEDIQPFKELTYDYNYAIDQVHDSDGNVKKKKCFCGSSECTGWLY